MIAGVEASESDLWEGFRQQQDMRCRDLLFELYAPWANAVAFSIHRRVPAYAADIDDFIQNARIGLLEAMSRFDPDKGVPFQSFARRRVRGAVFNGLRTILRDRPVLAREELLQQRLESITGDTGNEASAFDTLVDTIVSMGVAHLVDSAVHTALRVRSVDGYSYARAGEIESRVREAIARLPDRLRYVIDAHYREGRQFQQIALQLEVTKGRVSQLHRAAIERLRMLLRDLG